MSTRPTVPSPPSFEDLKPDAVLAEIQDIIDSTLALHDDLAARFTATSADFACVIRPIVNDTNRAACRLRILTTLLGQLSPDRELRDAAQQAETIVSAAQANIQMRPDIALLVAAVYEKEKIEQDASLDDQDRHLLAHVHNEYVRSGACLRSDDEHKELRTALEQISDLRTATQASFTEEEDGIWFERSALEGVPENILATLA
ncbi:Ff.00g066550.m01.CDS01 [Fusarium sp. VM40]|nr:Ff.00g066550.m01.CDS01 [Fusarium sp. VM40]